MATVQEAVDQIWSDEALKQRLLSDPKPVLREFGMEIPESVRVHVHENTREVFNAVLPVKPEGTVSLPNDALSQIIERAWSDPAYKQTLLSDPKDAAAEMGVRLPENVDIKIWENTATDEHMVLPANPAESELSDMDLEAVSGGTSKGGSAPTACVGGGAIGSGIADSPFPPGWIPGSLEIPSGYNPSSQAIGSTPASAKG